jgi:hypothetical protein
MASGPVKELTAPGLLGDKWKASHRQSWTYGKASLAKMLEGSRPPCRAAEGVFDSHGEAQYGHGAAPENA